jgi:hypothetical protein
MPVSLPTPDPWTDEHSKAFLLLCAAGVDGFERRELSAIVPLLHRLGVSPTRGMIVATEAFAHYKDHVVRDTVEDALVLYALEVKREAGPADIPGLLAALHEVSWADESVTEGERLVLRLLEQLWGSAPA